MDKNHGRRPFDQQKWSQGWEDAFGHLRCARCNCRVRKHEAKPLHDSRGQVGVLCPRCRKEAQ